MGYLANVELKEKDFHSKDQTSAELALNSTHQSENVNSLQLYKLRVINGNTNTINDNPEKIFLPIRMKYKPFSIPSSKSINKHPIEVRGTGPIIKDSQTIFVQHKLVG